MPDKPNFFTWCEELMEATGCSMDVAMREYQATFNPDYDPEDYD